jgi:anti-sigma-K factor RskA
MSAHEEFAEDLALHALGSLSGAERESLEQHLGQCAGCRAELEQLRGEMALMALSSSGPVPPRRSRARLLQAIAQEARSAPQTGRAPAGRWFAIPAFAALALAIALFALWGTNVRLSRRYEAVQRERVQNMRDVERARELLAMFNAPDAVHATLIAAKEKPQAQGKAMYLPSQGALLFMASNLAPLPPRKAYQLWVVPMQGAPVPAGTFHPDEKGSAMVMDPPIPKGIAAKMFGVTVEAEGGSQSPTLPMVMMSAGG